jgi:hypothetical protein
MLIFFLVCGLGQECGADVDVLQAHRELVDMPFHIFLTHCSGVCWSLLCCPTWQHLVVMGLILLEFVRTLIKRSFLLHSRVLAMTSTDSPDLRLALQALSINRRDPLASSTDHHSDAILRPHRLTFSRLAMKQAQIYYYLDVFSRTVQLLTLGVIGGLLNRFD